MTFESSLNEGFRFICAALPKINRIFMKTSPFLMAGMIVLPAFCAPSFCLAQNRTLLASDKLINFSKTLIPLNEGDKQGVTCDGIVWLKDAHFSSGTIEVDLRGKDVVQKS